MKILITGGAGFIGSNFVRYILKERADVSVVNVDLLDYSGNKENLSDVEGDDRYTFVRGDIRDQELMNKLVSECDMIYHFAAQSHVDRSITDSEEFVTTNVLGTQRILEALRKNPEKTMVHVSTDEVYGSIDEGSFTEQSNLEPNSPYSASKAGSDLLVRSYHETYDLKVITVRSTNNFGPYQFPEKFIPLAITNVLQDKTILVYGDGKNVRDWIFVEDCCAGILLAGEKGTIGEIYNIGGGNEWQNIDIAKEIAKELGKNPDDTIEFVDDRLGHDKRYSLDCAKLKQLGFSPSESFADNLKKTITWYKENESWWKPLLEKR